MRTQRNQGQPRSLKTERVDLRLTPDAKDRLERAAACRQSNLSDFILNSALAAAEDVIQANELLQLSEASTRQFFNLIDNPPELDDKMREAARWHDENVQVKW